MPAWFADWDPNSEEVRTVLETGAILPLRGYDKQGRFVLIFRQRFADPAIITTDQLYKTFIMLFSIAMEGNHQVSRAQFVSSLLLSLCHCQAYCRGYVIISDQEDVTIKHAMMLTPAILRQHIVVFQVVMSSRDYLVLIISCKYQGCLPHGESDTD